MTCNYTKSTNPMLVFSVSLLILISGVTFGFNPAFGQTEKQNDFVTITSEKLSNDPMIAKILENIEKSKREFSNMQNQNEQEQLIDEQRTLAKNLLDKELERMFKDNEDFTPLASFNKFLKTIPNDNTKIIFTGLFDYKEKKVDDARNALHEVLRNGGSLQEARQAYYDAAKIPRVEMIQVVRDLNIEAGFSDSEIQNHFDKNGKLPRFEDEQTSVISFVDLSSSAKNLNSSGNIENETSSTPTETSSTTSSSTTSSSTTSSSTTSSSTTSSSNTDQKNSNENLIQKLLEEIQTLKNKIKELETSSTSKLQNISEKNTTGVPLVYGTWLLDYSKGLGHKNTEVFEINSIPVNALNAPNSYTDMNNSLSLGRQGHVILGFSEPISEKLIIFEASSEKNIQERATVEVSLDGKNWIMLTQTQYSHDGSYVHEYAYDLSKVGCISHVKITDNANSIQGNGFDVDAIGATQKCANS